MSGAGTWIGVVLAGGAAAVARYGVDVAVERLTAGSLPIGTLVVNVSGSLALGLLVGAGVGGDAALLGGTAAMGSYTTLSTWLLESERLAEDGRGWAAACNVVASLALGLAAAGARGAAGAAL